MKTNFDKIGDEPQEEQYSDSEEESHIRKPMAYRDMTDAQYIRCTRRERFVGLAQSDKHSAVKFLEEHKQYFKNNYSQEVKEIMHRCIMQNGYRGFKDGDLEILREVFGPLQKCQRKPSNTQYAENSSYYRPPDTRLGEYKEMRTWTFDRFRRVWSNREGQYTSSLDLLSQDEKDALCDAFEQQIHYGNVLPFQREYTPEEDNPWINNI